jgi:Domain of unknown function (DUF4386)
MTNSTDYSPVQQHLGVPAQPGSRRWATSWSIRTASITAGVALLLMSVVAILGNVVVVDGLVTEGNATQTAADIIASAGLFRLGIASLVVAVGLDVVIAWALYRVFSPVNRSLSMLAAVMRLVYSGVFMVAVAQLVVVVRLFSDDGYRAVFGADQVNAQAMVGITAFNDIWYVGQFLFGLHLLLIGYLAYRSGYIPRLLGVLIAISGLGYATDSLGAVLSQGGWTDISPFTFIGEFLLALWLLIRARRIAMSTSALNDEQLPVAR